MSPRPFYGWTIVGVTFLAQLVTTGGVFYAFGILQKPIGEELGSGARFGVSFAPSIMAVVAAFAAPAIGRWVDRGPIRTLMLIGALCTAAGFLALAQITAIWQLHLVYGVLLMAGVALLGGVANPTLIANWFVRRRGAALGVSQFGVSLSGVLAALLVTALVESIGWRAALRLLALLPLALLPLLWLLVVDRPEQRGLNPDGAEAGGAERAPTGAAGDDWTMRRALREPTLWRIALVMGLCFAPNGAMVLLIHPYATDAGFSPGQAGAVLAAMAWMGGVGKPAFGWLGDRVPLRVAVAICLATQVTGLLLVLSAGSAPMLILAVAVFGLGYGGLMPLNGLLIGAFYGRWLFGRMLGLTQPMMLPFQFLGLPLASWIFDRTGSYRAALLIFIGMYALAGLLLSGLRPPEEAPDAPA